MFWKKETILFVLVLTLASGVQVAIADFTFGESTNLGPPISSSADEYGMSLSADGRILVFSSNRAGAPGNLNLWMSTRPTVSDPWPEPVKLGPAINHPALWDRFPSLSADGLSLYFDSHDSMADSIDIFMSTRATTDDDWGERVNLGPPVNNSSSNDMSPFISADGLELYFSSKNRPGGHGHIDLWVSTRQTKDDPWEEPVNLGPLVNTEQEESCPFVTADGLTLFFSCDWQFTRAGSLGVADIWMARRKTKDSDWSEPVNLGPPVNSASMQFSPTFSPDGSILYFAYDPWPDPPPDEYLGGNADLYQVPIEPVVDLNSDGIVDAADMCIIVDNWHTENTLCDIAPPPLGDGYVDVKDLIVLAEHLFEEFPPAEEVE